MPTTALRLISAALALAVATGSLAITLPAYADPPGGHKEKGHGRGGPDRGGPDRGPGPGRGGDDVNVTINFNFNDSDRMVVRDYYGAPPPRGHCTPGLAKKGNGCMPPGQAKKWMIGRPLPPDVIYYSLPPDIMIRMSAPPAGYKYVRVAGDILMIAAGTGMVAAAIEDLARM